MLLLYSFYLRVFCGMLTQVDEGLWPCSRPRSQYW